MNWRAQHRAFFVVIVAGPLLSACATVSHVTNLAEPTCRASFAGGVESILREYGEAPEVARALANQPATTLAGTPSEKFHVPSASGTTYRFLVDRKDGACRLSLWQRRGRWSRVTHGARPFLATRALDGCSCQPSVEEPGRGP